MWKYLVHSEEGEPVRIQGHDVWRHKWRMTGRTASVVDPQYGAIKSFQVWMVEPALGERIEFAAGEFSAGIWGFYVEE